MNKMLKNRLLNTLKSEAEYIMYSEDDIKTKIKNMNDVINITKIVEHYNELQPILENYFEKRAKENKWKDKER